jgi:hypothetical protein
MATLYINHINRSLMPLREWLNGDWGLVFSHPVDFQDHGVEQDRWLQILRDEFRASGVRPIAYRRDGGEPDRGWVTELMADDRRLLLTAREVIDITARGLREEILRAPGARFVLIVDQSLSSRTLVRYGAGGAAFSPLDLLGLVDVMRGQSAAGKFAYPRAA